MNKTFYFTTVVASMLFFSSFDGAVGVVPVISQPVEFSQFSQDNSYAFNTVSSCVIRDIEEEIDSLDESAYNTKIFENFIQTGEQLKTLVSNNNIKKMPDVLMFNKGYVGLSWEAKDDKTVFLYSLPEGKLFFQIVGANDFSERFTIDATQTNFYNLLQRVNALV